MNSDIDNANDDGKYDVDDGCADADADAEGANASDDECC